MQNKRLYRIASALLLFAYINLITLTVFHFHVVNINDQSSSIASSNTESQLVDPFSDGDANCSVTQFSTSSYINEKDLSRQKPIIYDVVNYFLIKLSNKPLQIIPAANSLRAPPLAS